MNCVCRGVLCEMFNLHTVPGSQVFVDDLSPCQVAHTTSDLDSHVNKVLLGDGLHRGSERIKIKRRRKNVRFIYMCNLSVLTLTVR